MIETPIIHVNGDDPEACVMAAKIAVEYRDSFKKDIIIDLFATEERGHNESDELLQLNLLCIQRYILKTL